jgi:NAD(P)-dependent dehydrogenase (short-subunit alcohol dehydrogenase family)
LIAGDVGQEEFCRKAIAKTIKEFAKIDILVNNAVEQLLQESIEKITERQVEIRISVRAALPRCPFCETTGSALFPAALSSAFARTRLASLFPATSSAFFTAALVRLIRGRPCSTFRFFAAYSAFLIAPFNLRCLSFLLRCVFLLASSCHGLPPG